MLDAIKRIALPVLVVACTGLSATTRAYAERKRFDGHQVVKLRIIDEAELQTVLALEAASEDFDIWSDAVGIGVVDVRVSAQQKALLDAAGLRYRITVRDIQTHIDTERSGAPGFFDDFRTYDEYVTFLNDLAAAYPNLAEIISLGPSVEGRDLWAVRITGPGANKPGVLYHGCQHAREWLSPPVVAYAAEYLLAHYDSDPTIAALVDNVEWFLLPIVNPDGYVYSWTTNRLWRKNRNYTWGVDLNRNWGWHWGGPGSSGSPYSDLYRGPFAFSEPETQAVRDFIVAHSEVRGYLDIHTFGNLLLWPWGYTSALPPDQPTFLAVGTVMANLVQAVHGTQYTIGPVYTTIYQVSGGSVDWVYGAEGRWAYSPELRGWGFIVPAYEIMPAAEENLPAMMYLAAWSAACDPSGFAAGLSMAPGAFADCNGNGEPDVCEVTDEGYDCNHNTVPDECDIADGTSEDCDTNGTPDECDSDCNRNGVGDGCDIIDGTSQDCNENQIPDECDLATDQCGPPIGLCPGEGDCLDPAGNGTPGCDCAACCHAVCLIDPFCCEVFWDSLCAWEAEEEPACEYTGPPGESQDCNENSVPDECEEDCNENDVPDECDIFDCGPPVGSCPGSGDCCNPSGNGTPGCDCSRCCAEVCADDPSCCTGIWDNWCAFMARFGRGCDCGGPLQDWSYDCNVNSVPDECDITDGSSEDCNVSGVPDECEPTEACCLPDGSCVMTLAACCVTELGGTPQGEDSQCGGVKACCLPDGTCVMADGLCCVNELGGVPHGPGTVCTALEACCLSNNTCEEIDPLCCPQKGGDPQGPGSVCLGVVACHFRDQTCVDIDQHCCLNMGGTPKAGESCLGVEACCMSDNACEDIDALVCLQKGGDPKGPGSLCLGIEACCLPNNTCEEMDAHCCLNKGGSPQGPGSVCRPLQVCCLGNTCEDLEPKCCIKTGGSPQGPGSACTTPEPCCLPDHSCKEMDPLCCGKQGGKMVAACPCGACCLKPMAPHHGTDYGCVDNAVEAECPDADRKFFPERGCDEIDCTDIRIPTMSSWGVIILTLLLMVGGKVYFRRTRAGRTAA